MTLSVVTVAHGEGLVKARVEEFAQSLWHAQVVGTAIEAWGVSYDHVLAKLTKRLNPPSRAA